MAITLAASLVAILLLAGAARWLRLGHDARIDREEAVAAAEDALPGFEAEEVLVATDGGGALAVGGDGRLALVKRHGARAAVREVRWTALRVTPVGLEVDTGERRFGRVALAGVDALALWRVAKAEASTSHVVTPGLTRGPAASCGEGRSGAPAPGRGKESAARCHVGPE